MLLVAQPPDLRFDRISIADGLSQSSINCLYQDSYGFLWIGTEDGLNRYDGYEFTVYLPDQTNPKSIASNFMYDIVEDNNRNLWIATRNGLSRFNYEKETFTNYIHTPNNPTTIPDNDVMSCFVDSKGTTWAGSKGGLSKISLDDGIFKAKNYQHILNDSTSLVHNYIWEIFEDSNGYLWLGTDNGLSKFDPKNETFTNYIANPDDPDAIWGEVIHSIAEDSQGNIWLGSFEAGLNKFDPKTGKFKHYNIKTGYNVSNLIFEIYVDDNQNIWVGTYEGLNLYDKQKDDFYHYSNDPKDLGSLSFNIVQCIYKDKGGVLWIGTDGGLNKVDLKKKQFNHYRKIFNNPNSLINNRVWAFCEDSQGYIWIGTSDGLDRFDPENKVFKHFKPKFHKDSLATRNIWAIIETKDKHLWLGTWGQGLFEYDRETGKFKNYIHESLNPNSLSSDFVRSLYEDKDGIIWIGTYGGGLCTYNRKTNEFGYYLHDKDDTNSLSHEFAYSIYEDQRGTIWVATRNGLSRFDKRNETFKRYRHDPASLYSISHNYIRCFHEDVHGNLWIGTSGGLNRFDHSSERFFSYTKKDGLPNDVVYGILSHNKQLWLSTNKGISCFDTEKETFKNYEAADGLQSNEFNGGAYYKSRSGKLYFGGINGFNSFYPDSIKENDYIPPIVITNFQILNETVPIGADEDGRVILEKSIYTTDKIFLDHNDYFFSFEFASLHFARPKRNKYAYMLKGFDQDWIYINADKRFATYTNLNPGKYTFLVKGTNKDGKWNNVPASIKINVIPPFWLQTWFYFVVGFFVIINLVLFIKIRENNLLRGKRELEEAVKSRTKEIEQHRDEIEKQRDEIEKQRDEIEIQHDEIKMQRDYLSRQNDQIIKQNKELEIHRRHLERLVRERTEDLVKAKEKAEESDRLKTSFLANMSHEIRTPMNAIIGFSQLLSKPDLKEDQRKEFIKLINDSSESLLVLIDDILDISRIEANQLKIEKSDVELTALLNDLFVSFSNQVKQSGREIEIRLYNPFGENEFLITTDPQRLKQILANLLSNAMKYTEKGFIEFGFNIEDFDNKPLLEFYVKDTGIGLPDDMIDKVFDRFRKVEKGNRKVYRGAGLGLTICKNLLKILGGSIRVESKLNIGSTFYFTIPFEKGKGDDFKVSDKEKGIAKHNWNQKTIMIVEDDTINYKFLEVGLKPTNVKILWAKTGVEAVDMFKENKIDLILMDIQLPVMDGLEATTKIKKLNKDVPVIAQTAFALSIEKEQIFSAGCDDYMAKPIVMKTLIDRISQLFDSE